MNSSPSLLDASAYSRFVQRIRRRYVAQRTLLAPGEPRRSSMESALAALRALRADMLLLDNCYGCSFMTAGAAAVGGRPG